MFKLLRSGDFYKVYCIGNYILRVLELLCQQNVRT